MLTASDTTVALGLADLGTSKDKIGEIGTELAKAARTTIQHLLERVIDRMKTSPEDICLLLVGGGEHYMYNF